MRFVGVAIAVLAVSVASACGSSDQAVDPLAEPCGPLLYEGEGKPDLVVVSDLPLRADRRAETAPMVKAITQVLRAQGFRAGSYRVGYQSCDDSVGQDWDEARCVQNARAYVANRSVVGVIGTYNSGCATVMLPILSRKAAGPLAMISPSNTYLGLTRDGPGTEGHGPDRYYPEGLRNYVRVAPPDDVQGAAAAVAARDRGARRAVVLVQRREAYAAGVGAAFGRAAVRLGMRTTTLDWKPAARYTDLVARVAARRPDAVYLAGLANANGRQLVEDLRASLEPRVLIIGPDAWARLAADIGPAGEGMLVTSSGVPPELLPPRGKAMLRAAGDSGQRGQSYTAEAAQAAEVLLAAIGRSDGTRASVVEELFRTRVTEGILGDFAFDAAGDIDPAFFTLSRFHDGDDELVRLVRAPTELVRAER